MITILASVLGLLAIASWVLAIFTAIQIVQLVPQGHGFDTWIKLGRWDFGSIRQLVGAALDPLKKRYIGAFVVFFAVIILAIGLTFLLAAEAQNGTAATARLSFPLLPTGSQET